jgi:hypothetical protein
MSSCWKALAIAALLASQEANAACVIHGARPTVPLPTMLSGQEFSFIASPDCETLRFTIRGTDVSKRPMSGGPVRAGPQTYKVVLTENEWSSVVAESGTTLTWVVAGRTSSGGTTRMVTTNDLKRDDPITIDLSMADAKLVGEESHGQAGAVAGAGDVNGDGHADLLVGAGYYADLTGAAYLVLGPLTGTRDLALADAKLVGEEDGDYAGASVSGAGDVDGDGHDDLVVGAPGNHEGAAYLMLGPVSGTRDLGLADAKLVGEEDGDHAGSSVSYARDLNGDDHDDLLLGAPYNDEGGDYAGAAYVVLGPVSGTLDLSLAHAKLVGDGANDYAYGVSGAGDVDGDGRSDLLVGAAQPLGLAAGAAYLVLGPVTGTLDLSMADAMLAGEPGDRAGETLSDAGDVDSDGHDDVLVGAFHNSEGGMDAGAAYLVLGPVTGTLDLSFADAKFVGESRGDFAGNVSGAGDVDADGHDDVLVGSVYNDEGGTRAGAAYLVLGPVTGTVDLSRANLKLMGEEAGDLACGVSGAGDVDADGRDDLLVGAPRHDEGGADAGAAYLIYGGGP